MEATFKTRLIVLTLVVTLAMLAACRHGAASGDPRLETADSVLRYHPDSALTLLTAIEPRSLHGEGDRAYHALLLTQAQYRCYIAAKSDSIINVALDYYKRHAVDQEKLTRAYIYKGAVMEELGHPEEAMTYYKRAMTQAAPDDAFNQGYARLRVGNIYRDYLVADTSDIILLKEAFNYFKMVPDSFYMLSSLSTLGGCYIKSQNNDSSLAYLERALALAKSLHETYQEHTVLRYIAGLKMYSKDARDLNDAKQIALSLINDKDYPHEDVEHLLMIASFTLAKQSKTDSARFYLNRVDPKKLSPSLMIFYNKCCAELAIRKGDVNAHQHYFELADEIADSLVTNNMQRQLKEVEAKYDNEALKYQVLKYRTKWIVALLVAGLVLCLLGMVAMFFRRQLARRRRQLQDSEDTIERLRNDSAHLSSQLNANQAMSEDLKSVIRNQIEVFTQLVEAHMTCSSKSSKKFNEVFEKKYQVNHPDGSFWKGIRSYADSQYNDIITRTSERFPSLRDSDLNFLSLYCCDMPITVIMVCMGYNDIHSAYNKRRRLANAVECSGDLDAYIRPFKKS